MSLYSNKYSHVILSVCRFVEEKKPLVLDTLVTWHLTLLASTARSSVQAAPALRDTLITQSR